MLLHEIGCQGLISANWVAGMRQSPESGSLWRGPSCCVQKVQNGLALYTPFAQPTSANWPKAGVLEREIKELVATTFAFTYLLCQWDWLYCIRSLQQKKCKLLKPLARHLKFSPRLQQQAIVFLYLQYGFFLLPLISYCWNKNVQVINDSFLQQVPRVPIASNTCIAPPFEKFAIGFETQFWLAWWTGDQSLPLASVRQTAGETLRLLHILTTCCASLSDLNATPLWLFIQFPHLAKLNTQRQQKLQFFAFFKRGLLRRL